jgi:protein phosphatase
MDWITIGSATDIGCVKDENQDYHTWHPREGETAARSGALLILADGMGGHADGAQASQLATSTLLDLYLRHTSDPVLNILERGFIEANRIIFEKSAEMLTAKGMGTTLVAAYVKGGKLQFAHVGDSRGYLINKDGISQFTEDHSYVASLVKAGVIKPEEAEDHPESHVLTRAIGLQESVSVDTSQQPLTLKKGDYVILCCDGLWGVVPDEEILAGVRQDVEPTAISENLVKKAIDNGGPDNITVLIARINKTGWISGLF